jgi:predicted amidohydrolase
MRIAIAQISMHWTTDKNLQAIERAMIVADSAGAQICCFSELAVTGFHREIAREATAEVVRPALEAIAARAARLSLAVSVGAPAIASDGRRFIAQYLINERGQVVAEIRKRGLTDPEATFFSRGDARPVELLQGLRCTAVICREIEDVDSISMELPPGSAQLVLVPGALRQDPEKPRTDPPPYVANIQRLAAAMKAYVVHTNWPNALNRPEESVDGGGSNVASPDGELLFRLPMQKPGIGVFKLGERTFDWLDE